MEVNLCYSGNCGDRTVVKRTVDPVGLLVIGICR